MPDTPTPLASQAFSRTELCAVWRRPHRLLDLLLGERERFVSTVRGRHELGLVVVLLVAGSALFALPFGFVLGAEGFWRIGALFLGSLLICFPSLHVFTVYLGRNASPGENLALALVVSAVAAIFSLGFFPILWFLAATTGEASAIGVPQLSAGLLVVCLLAGVAHLWRCARSEGGRAGLFLVWECLLLYISWKMALALRLL